MTKNQSKTVPLYLLHAATRERFEHLDRVHAYFKELKEKVRSARILETGHN